MTVWNKNNKQRKFGVEAKLLAEFNWNTRNANNLSKEYVEDAGMGKYINGIYYTNNYNDAIMLGYYINGNVSKIVEKLNVYSSVEILFNSESHYISNYIFQDKSKKLNHIFLNFSKLVP